jgi:hypothetical protein
MKNTITSLSLLLAGALLVNVALADDFTIQNDWHFAGLNKPVKQITVQEAREDGEELQKTQTSFNEQGFITEIIYDDSLRQSFEPYQGKVRNIAFIYEAEGEEQRQELTTTWLAENHIRFDDGDLVIDTFFDSEGKATRHELFMDSTTKPDEITQYQYINVNDPKPEIKENYVFVTNLELNQYGNWVKQKEEKINDKPMIRTRTIEYFP